MIMSRFLAAIAIAATLSMGGFVSADMTTDSDTLAGPLDIPDDGHDGTLGSFVTDTITVTGHTSVPGLVISDISVDIAVTHTWIGDLTLMLQTPDGSFVGLMSRPGFAEVGDGSGCCGPGDDWVGQTENWSVGGTVDAETMTGAGLDVGTAWAANPDSMVGIGSVASMSDLLGGSPNGDWTLWASDSVAADAGTIDGWSITVTSVAVPEPTAAIFIGLGALGLCVRRKR